jgi:peptidoglycan/xylan/chitin deacetylase (PgdA/CDA1 family)
VYLTFDTGHMGVASFVADVLRRQRCRSRFLPPTSARRRATAAWAATGARGGRRAPPRARAGLAHLGPRLLARRPAGARAALSRAPSAGAFAGREFTWSAEQYCANIAQASERLAYYSGKKPLPLFRAPGGKTSPRLLAAAEACGYRHVGWSPAGFLGDELPSDKYPNQRLLERALKTIQPGDILLAHLGIWSRQDPWAPAVLEPLIEGLKARGLCFATLRGHPAYADWIAMHGA